MNDIYRKSQNIDEINVGGKYLRNRGLQIPNSSEIKNLKSHKNLYYKDESGERSTMPALLGIIKKNDKAIGIQRIYINENHLKYGKPKILGELDGGYVEIGGETQEEMHLAEGIETALAISLAIKQPVCAAISANNLSKVIPAKTVKTIHLWADKDLSMTGESEAIKAINAFKMKGLKCFFHLPSQSIEEGKKSFDYLDVYNINPSLICDNYIQSKEFKSIIKPIETPHYILPNLEETHVPFVLRDWTFQHSERLNVSPELVIFPLISILGSLIGRKLAMQPKKNDNWKEYANLWCMIIGIIVPTSSHFHPQR